MVCTVDPIMIAVESLKPWMRKCNNYKYRPAGEKIQPLCPSVGTDGLYPGQIKPPTDYSDFDPDEVETTATAPDEVWDIPISSGGNIAVQEPECDT